MKLEDQVCSLDLAKRLKELGVKQESYFVWYETPRLVKGEYDPKSTAPFPHAHVSFPWTLGDWADAMNNGVDALDKLPAYTVAELGEMLPSETRTVQWLVDGKMYWVVNNIGTLTDVNADSTVSEADARANMLIYLIENNLITV